MQKTSGDASDSEIAATAAAFSEKFGGGGADPVAGGKTSEFRRASNLICRVALAVVARASWLPPRPLLMICA